MHEIARTLLAYPSVAKWMAYEGSYRRFFEERDDNFDNLIDLIRRFYTVHQSVPDHQAIRNLLSGAKDRVLMTYVQSLQNDQTLPVYSSDVEFAAQLDILRTQTLLGENHNIWQGFQTRLATGDALYPAKVAEEMKTALGDLHQALARFEQADLTQARTVFGEEAHKSFCERYEANEEKRRNNQTLYYPLMFRGAFDEVLLTPGDFLTIPGFTSQCKSVLAREICYFLRIYHQRNVMFVTTEMTAGQVDNILAIRHANNKQIFPGTPKIPFNAYRHASLTPEQKDFLYHAHQDLVLNPDYGAMQIEQTQPDFNLGDLAERCAVVERTLFPIHICAVDYLSQINPLRHNARASGDAKSDVNRMFYNFRQFLLNYKNVEHKEAPLIGISPVQIGQGKYNDAIKNDRMYDATAPGDYNEIERSSTHMISVLMTREMREAGLLRVQCLKNREGAVPVDAYEVQVALAYGMGVREFAEPDEAELSNHLYELDALQWGSLLKATAA